MRQWIPIAAVLLCAAFVASTLLPPKNPGQADVIGFGSLPVLADGRIKPLETVARSSLLMIQGKQSVLTPDGRRLVPDEWLLDVFFDPARADTYEIFKIDNPDVLALVGKTDENLSIRYKEPSRQTLAVLGFLPTRRHRFPYSELAPYLQAIDGQAKLADSVDSASRNAFQRSILQLQANLSQYLRVRQAFLPPGDTDFLGELLKLQENLPDGVEAVRSKEAGKPYDEEAAGIVLDFGQRFVGMADSTNLLVVPPVLGETGWKNCGQALLESFGRGQISTPVLAYVGMGYAWKGHKDEQFNHLVGLYRNEISKGFSSELRKCGLEVRFNATDPFNSSLTLYLLAFFLAVLSWLKWPQPCSRCALGLMSLAWVVATTGIITRMCLEGRPPVTNLYSSALFIGWGAVGLCVVLEILYKNSIGSAAGGLIGFATLIIAHHLALGGDTLEMMRAVLDNNFWLATHVVVVTTGYAATFLAGLLAVIYILRGALTRSLDPATADALARMVYGIVCFATLFSFVGTVLGGIWADQSWGRFWGWDPKENGALIIVLWNALILHARWGGLVRHRGLMALAVFGNVVTAWSWFGTNMLGIGLHSYGFTEAAFWWLIGFVLIQLGVIAVALIPPEKWESFRADQM